MFMRVFPSVVETLSQDEMEKLGLLYTTIKNKTKGDKQYKPMLNKTRELLYEFYDPYTTRLPQLLNDSTFVWPKLSYQEYVNKMEKKRTKTDESWLNGCDLVKGFKYQKQVDTCSMDSCPVSIWRMHEEMECPFFIVHKKTATFKLLCVINVY